MKSKVTRPITSPSQGRGVEAPRLMARREFESIAAGVKFPFFAIGHSARPIGEFTDLLIASEIGIVVDVRTVRDRGQIRNTIADRFPRQSGFQIAYEHVAELGRPPRPHKGYCTWRQCLLAKSEFSQLRRLCDEQQFSLRPRPAPRSGPRAALRRDVRGDSVVAVPSSDHRGLSGRWW